MFNTLILIGLLLGLDSLAVGVGLGAVTPDCRRRWRLALAFGLCDGLASYLGFVFGVDRLRSALEACEWLGPAALACYGLYVLGLAWRSRQVAEIGGASPWLAFGLPLCLSLDNLVAGVGPDASEGSAVLAALTFGIASGCLALLGMYLGAVVANRVRPRAGWLGGTMLVVVAVALLCRELLS